MLIKKRQTVVSNGNIDIVLNELEEYINRTPKWKDIELEITSGVRTPEIQLAIIHGYAIKRKIKFAEFDPHDVEKKTVIDGKEVYCWQRTWSKLLNVGVIINPCFEAECLFDYFVGKVNKKGKKIPQSTHMQGRAFDISGNAGLDNIKEILDGAMKENVGITSYLVERENNAVHCNIK